MAPLEQRQERLRHFQQTEEVDREVLFKQVEIAQIVVDGNARIVDEDVERFDLIDCLPDLRGAGHVQR